MNRRDLIKTMGLSPLFSMGSGLGLAVGSQLASANATFSDYKALVVVFLDGGNDAMNMFIPTDNTTHGQYAAIRGTDTDGLAITNTDLSAIDFTIDANNYYIKNNGINHPYYDAPQSGDGLATSAIRSYKKGCYYTTNANNSNATSGLGINSMMPELASMYQAGKVSLISNVGTLVRPTSQAQINNDTAELPVFLFAHNHQKRAVYTAQAEQLGTTGWAGRIADAWQVNDPVGLNLSYDQINRMLIGQTTSPLAMPTTTPVSFTTRYNPGNNINGDAFESILNRFNNITNNNAFATYYASKTKKAADLSTILLNGMASAPDFSTFTAKNSYGQTLFTIPDMATNVKLTMHDGMRETIFQQLEAAAKMIKVGKDTLNHTRQIIYVRLPGFDSHSQQTLGQANNLRAISLAVSDFQKALEEMNLADQVLTLSLSDFGRTLKNNSDGTDHGWGGHNFMMTGDSSFQGGNVLGTVMTDLTLNGINAYTEKGRIIPTTSIEQMLAPALKWFGVDNTLMATILPNLSNFRTNVNDVESSFLQGIFS